MNYTIGGVERIIAQVDTYADYNNTDNMTAQEIFDNSRADKAFLKELQKSTIAKIVEFSGGVSVNLPTVKFLHACDILSGGTEIEKARKLEEHYTQESIEIARG
jgi:hypothetical protein